MAMSRATAMTAALARVVPPVLHFLVDVDRGVPSPASMNTAMSRAPRPRLPLSADPAEVEPVRW